MEILHADLCIMDMGRAFWEERYDSKDTGWDIGGPSTPLKEYIDQLANTELHILIPGGGRAYEAEYAHRLGYRNVHVIDLTDAPFRDLLARCPDFPKEHLIVGDLFEHEGRYDRILEQTFFCAIHPTLRERYVERMHALLRPGGKLVGVLFDAPLNTDRPPFGGDREEYLPLFRTHFPKVTMERCHNSIAPRAGRECWLHAPRDEEYAPIPCTLYDRLEEAATLQQVVDLTLEDGSRMSGRIVDLFTRDGSEWLRSEDGREVRLDAIRELNR